MEYLLRQAGKHPSAGVNVADPKKSRLRCLTLLLTLFLLAPVLAQSPRPLVGRILRHTVGEGEDLVQIALRYHLSVDHLAYANGFPITTLEVQPGTRLWIPGRRVLPANPPRNGLVVNLAERMCYLFREGRFDSYYPVSIGDEAAEKGRFQTPTGNFRVIEKIVNPTWYPPSWAKDRTPVGPGPNNPLGERWVGLSLPRTGIHGTNDPLNVGNSVTHGCMRMYPSLLKEFYQRVDVGFEARLEYETSKVGRDSQGRFYFVNFPNIYSKAPAQLAGLALQRRLKPRRANWPAIVELQLGMPVEIGGRGPVEEEWEEQTED